ncbi:hypothetical protein NC652_029421 [Populus alba x Populus x berolinensis]|nr:hypothetical protein NC652_029421 [Populus alba x Populus x berolinensis]
MKTQSDSSLLSTVRLSRREKILEVDGTVTTQPVLEHVGISTWPGRVTLTDHALYYEALRVVSYDKPKTYDLADDLKQIVNPELTGPWGTRLFDKAVLYKSISLSEPAVIEFPELKGHTRRDYWLAVIREILFVHRFIKKFKISGVERDAALSLAVLGILRLQAIQEIISVNSVHCETLLIFNLCDQLPGGDLILETLANISSLRKLDRTNSDKTGGGVHSISARAMVSNLGFMLGTSSTDLNEAGLVVGETAVGKMSSLEKVVKESQSSFKKAVLAQETVDGVKVDGIDTNLAVMKELLLPVMEIGRWLISLIHWDDPMKSLVFCLVLTYIIWSGVLFVNTVVEKLSLDDQRYQCKMLYVVEFLAGLHRIKILKSVNQSGPPNKFSLPELCAYDCISCSINVLYIRRKDSFFFNKDLLDLHFRGWLGYTFGLMIILLAIFMVLTRFCNQGRPVDEIKVTAPPPMNTVEQLLAVQDAISQAEQFIQDGNIVLLKFRGLLLSIFPQASEKFAFTLLGVALILAFMPSKYIILLTFLETFTRYSPPRTASTERWTRRLREWWFSIPAAPVVLEREREDKKKK